MRLSFFTCLFQIIDAATAIALFLLDAYLVYLVSCFYSCINYFFFFLYLFHLLFLTLIATRRNLQLTMFNLVLLQPAFDFLKIFHRVNFH